MGLPELLIVLALPIAIVWALTRVSRHSGYRALADQMVAANEANERRLAEIAAELSTIRSQLASLERVLTQIE
jgi:hypothetical protein